MLTNSYHLPTLRDDLKLLESSPSEDGSKSWLIYDPLQNKYFTIGIDAFRLFSLWESGCEINKFFNKLKVNKFDIDKSSFEVFIGFLKSNKLIKIDTYEETKKLYEENENSKQGFLKWLIHNYLFIRVPLFKSDKWLENNLNKVNFLYSSTYKNIVFLLGFIGILLVFRNYEDFFNTFSYLFSTQGMFYYILSIIFVKSLHELGHAFTAKRYGVKVPHIGVAFLVLFPVMYTHTTDSWKLKSKYKRLQIVLAGVKVELYLALIATFLWSFLPDGIFKTIAFIVATTSWITSILINISPFLRFDGYYALSDWSDSKNLQPRSFAMGRWFLRKYILGANEKVPEYLPKYKQDFFIIYAICTWIYRFFLFLGIALLVYFFTFKVLGIILFIIEILWFIVIPIYKELKIWFERFSQLSLNLRNTSSLILFSSFIALLFIPWNTKVSMPAILETKEFVQIHSPNKSKIKQIYIKDGQFVNKGDILITFSSSFNDLELKQVNKEIKLIELTLDKVASAKDLLNNKFVLQQNLLKLKKKKEGLENLKNEMIIKAPFSGMVYINDNFHKGIWVKQEDKILTLYNPKSLRITAYCEQNDIKFLTNNSNGKLFLDNGEKPKNVKVTNISNVSLPNIEFLELSSEYGGDIAITKDKNGSLISQKAYYKIDAELLEVEESHNVRKNGVLIVESKPQSIIEKIYIHILAVIIRESGF